MSFADDAQRVLDAVEVYCRESLASQKPVITLEPLADIIRDLKLSDYVEEGGLTGCQLTEFLETYLSKTTRLHSPTYMAHQVAVPHYAGALGALINGVTNNAMAIYEMGPGASSIEFFLINWMLSKVGWHPAPTDPTSAESQAVCGGGVLMHGGSLANLCGLLAARQRAAPEAWQTGNPANLVVLAPPGAHYSVARAAGILGLGQQAIVPLDADDRGAIRAENLPALYHRLCQEGKHVFALVANACSTAVGVYDPLEDIGDFCREHQIWLHVDGAHGASALLSTQQRHRLQGIDKADSVSWDAHKLLQTSVLCAALLVRDHRDLDRTFQQEASYLFHEKVQPGFDFIQRTVECTKAGLGLKLFLVLAALGEKGLADTIDRQVLLTTGVYHWLQTQEDILCPVAPESNILCFRVRGCDRLQLRIRDRLIAQGRFYISTTCFSGVRYLRLVLMNPQTRLTDVQELIQTIRQLRDDDAVSGGDNRPA